MPLGHGLGPLFGHVVQPQGQALDDRRVLRERAAPVHYLPQRSGQRLDGVGRIEGAPDRRGRGKAPRPAIPVRAPTRAEGGVPGVPAVGKTRQGLRGLRQGGHPRSPVSRPPRPGAPATAHTAGCGVPEARAPPAPGCAATPPRGPRAALGAHQHTPSRSPFPLAWCGPSRRRARTALPRSHCARAPGMPARRPWCCPARDTPLASAPAPRAALGRRGHRRTGADRLTPGAAPARGAPRPGPRRRALDALQLLSMALYRARG